MQQLFLKIDRVRGNDRLFVPLECEEDRRREISERFAHAGSGFDHQMALFLQRFRDSRRHLLLLWAELKVPSLRQRSVLGEKRTNPFHKFAADVVF